MILDLCEGTELPSIEALLDRIETDRIARDLDIEPGDDIRVNVRSQVAA